MLYVLPPPRAPNPPSPWDSIICGSSGANASVNSDSYSWGASNSGSNNNPSKTSAKRKTRLYSKLSSSVVQTTTSKPTNSFCVNGEDAMGRHSKSLSECYFAGKGTALVLPEASETQKSSSQSTSGCNIQKHLQSMFYLLRPEETLKMAVKLESVHPVRSRYLVVVSRMGRKAEESCLLGIDCNEKTTVGLVLRVLADTSITLDGDGGFSVTVCGRHHIFKPVSVQAMWSALQTLHKLTAKARHHNHFHLGPPHTHSWISHYEVPLIQSDRSCLNEWHAMDSLESRRPPSPDSVLRTKPTEREQTERVIRDTLKEIMMSVDLDEVTSKCIRGRLEEELDMDLGEYKSFIDEEMLVVLGQMDAPTEVFEYVYLGSEWNASNYEELQRNGVGHILNVTREIDNFFPGTFNYLNIRVYDDEKTDLLKYWDDTFKYISRAKQEGSKVLVHCKMGVSRSASVVIAYAMKAYNWNFDEAMRHVKEKRNCIKPNSSFITQLETYQGILDAMKNKEKLQRSKSESNLKSPLLLRTKNEVKKVLEVDEKFVELVETSVEIVDQVVEQVGDCLSGEELRTRGARPKSWSPSNQLLTTNTSYNNNDSTTTSQVFLSLENITNQQQLTTTTLGFLMDKRKNDNTQVKQQQENNTTTANYNYNNNVRVATAKNKSETGRNVLLPCDNGESYSVSPNQIVHLPNQMISRGDVTLPSVKDRVSELEDKRRQLLCLNLTPVFEQELLLQQQQQGEEDGDSLVRVPFLVDSTINDKSSECVIDSWDPGERELLENGKELTEKCKELTERCKKQLAGKCKEELTGKCKELLNKCKEQLVEKNKEQLVEKCKEQMTDKCKEQLADKCKEEFADKLEQQLPERLKQQLLQKLDQQLLPHPLDKQLPHPLDKQLPQTLDKHLPLLADQQLPHRFEGKQLPEKLEQELPERLKQQLLQKHEKYLSEKFEQQLLPEKLEKQLSDKLDKQLTCQFERQLSDKFEKQLSDKLEKQLSDKLEKQLSDKLEKQLSDKLKQVSEKLEGKQPQKLLTNCDNKKTTNKSTRSNNRRRKSIGEELFASDKEDEGQQLQRDELLKRVDLQNMLREDLSGVELRKHDDLWKISGNKSHPFSGGDLITLPPPPVTPSRQSSCSSIDSSGVSVTPSRNSSCSTTTTTSLPSRNSSWGSYDMRGRRRGGQQLVMPRDEHDDEDSDDDEYHHHCEAVNATLVNHHPQQPQRHHCHYRSSKSSGDVTTSAIDITRNRNHNNTTNNNNNKTSSNSNNPSSGNNKHCRNSSVLLLDRLSVSAPPPATAKHYLTSNAIISKSTSNIATGVGHHTSQLLTTTQSAAAAAGIVKSLKKEFESKNDGISNKAVVVDDVRVQQAFETTEDKFKQLLGKFEVKQANNSVVSVVAVAVDPLQRRVISGNHPEGNGVYRNRHSCIEVSVEKSPVRIRQKMTGSDDVEFANKCSRPPKGPISQNSSINHHNSSSNHQNPSINPQNHHNSSISHYTPINHHNPINSINTTTKQYGKSHPLARINTTFKSPPAVHHTPPVLYNHPPVLYHTM